MVRMKSLVLTCILGAVLMGSINAQKIEYKKAAGSYKFYQEDRPLSAKQLESKLDTLSDAYVFLEAAKMNRVMATVLNCAGGFLMGWTVGSQIAGGDPNWNLAAIGAGAMVLAIPLSISYSKNMKKAVDIHNDSLETTSYRRPKLSLKFVASMQAVGLRIVF